ncbi:MAG: D-Ala-D-Ala carboxypeptidase family metallohydrolase [Candidatus Aenigmatarchaeota archaeon]
MRIFEKRSFEMVGQFFKAIEFDCPCEGCRHTLIDLVHVARLDQLRRELERPIRITSGYRCQRHNAKVGGSSNSLHMRGMATDTNSIKESELAICRRIFPRVIVYPGYVHLDSKPGGKFFLDRRQH